MPLLLYRLKPPTHFTAPSQTRHLFTGSWLKQSTPQTRRPERSRDPQAGLTTPVPESSAESSTSTAPKTPFYFAAGYAGWAKRPSRPFPPPFFSPPSGSFSDPLSTHDRSSMGRPKVHGEMIRGVTNGDDAMLVSETLIATNDGVGAWAQRERGCAPLWSRLLVHFWALAAEKEGYGREEGKQPKMVEWLEQAYEDTKGALSGGDEWLGTTTASGALLHSEGERLVVYVVQLGDCQILVVRPKREEGMGEVLFASKEQYHYFDCPRQLGTNSPDTPLGNAVLDIVDVEDGDVVLAVSDGVTDNLWEEEISAEAIKALKDAEEKFGDEVNMSRAMKFVAQQIVLAARKIAEDPFATSPFMEKAVEEGLAIEGGKLDDISVVAAICKRRKG